MNTEKLIKFVTDSKRMAESELRRTQVRAEDLQLELHQTQARIQQLQNTISECDDALKERE